jgi:hypothetical protein
MNLTQLEKIYRLKESFLKRSATDIETYEFKNVEVLESNAGTVFVILEVGRIGDENTLMSLYRTSGNFAIGPKGGVRVLSLSHGLSGEVEKKYVKQWIK